MKNCIICMKDITKGSKSGKCKSCAFKNIKFTDKHKENLRNAHKDKIGDKAPNWKGNEAQYFALHQRVSKIRGKHKICENCGTTDSRKRYEWANISGRFEDVMDYKRLCKKCHSEFDKSKCRDFC